MTKSSTTTGVILDILGMASLFTTILIFILMAIRYIFGVGDIGYRKTQVFNVAVLTKKGFFIGKKIKLLNNEPHYRLTVTTQNKLLSPLQVKLLDKDHRVINEFVTNKKNADGFILEKTLRINKPQDIFFALNLSHYSTITDPGNITLELTNASRSIQLSYHLRVFWMALVATIILALVTPNNKT